MQLPAGNFESLEFLRYPYRIQQFSRITIRIKFNNVINLRSVKNDCIKRTGNHFQLTLSDDKLHKGAIELEFKDYETMKKQKQSIPAHMFFQFHEEFQNTLRMLDEYQTIGLTVTARSSPTVIK